ncbi:FAD-binding oxidoreductase [Lentzea sp. NPDC006480]|uniref:FAD-binding oxidoreductase n=1 Tax=Lentzea sp. NPDC006480 TaxID=3157176 RepID=UPI0033B44E8A
MRVVGERALASAQVRQVGNAAWTDLTRRIEGRVVRPPDSLFGALAAPANTRYEHVLPHGIVLPTTESDIAAVLGWADKHQVPVVARSGGHSYAGYSTTGGLLMRLDMFDQAAVDLCNATVTVQAGARNRDLLRTLASTGLTLPFGRCPTIGIAGYTLGGGLGLHTRRLGMASDRLLATRLVTAGGEVLSCDEDSNADLFWASRGGGGGNFGISTAFTYQLCPTPDVTVFRLAFDGRKAEEVLLAMQDLITDPQLRYSFAAQFGATATGRDAKRAARNVTLYAEGWYYGPRSNLETILTRVTSVARPTSSYVAELDGLGAQRYFTDEVASDPFMTTSVVARIPMRATDAARVVAHLHAWPGSSSRSGASVSFFAMGGADQDMAPDATAFVHRDALFVLAATHRWTTEDGPEASSRATEWIAGVRRDMSAHLGTGSFVNFPDPALPRWWDAYYGSNYPRLARIKSEYDPSGLFHYPQSVRPLEQLPSDAQSLSAGRAAIGPCEGLAS